MNKKFKVDISFSLKNSTEVEVNNKTGKADLEMVENLAVDKATEEIEARMSSSRKIDEFWEYNVKYKVDNIQEVK